MQLTYVTISNYRSITSAYKIDLSNLTVLLGKNNEGKTNIIRAIKLGMDILQNIDMFYPKKRLVRRFGYEWHLDYPLSLQNARKEDKSTAIRFDFNLTPVETQELYGKIGSNINGALSIYISIGQANSVSVTVPKRGKNAKSISGKIIEICEYINQHFMIQYIPAVRSESDAYGVIMDLVEYELSDIMDEEYRKSLEYISGKQQELLNSLADKVKQPLKKFLPQVKEVSLYIPSRNINYSSRYIGRRDVNFDINDGVRTSLSNKGDGVKSLATIALLSQLSSRKERLIIIDEPENHLHPEAVRYINTVVQDLAKNNQVLISTHSPIFVNRVQVSSNIIVDKGNAYPAKRVDEIRNVLGVICSDNLIYADYVIVVEGPSDRELIVKMLNSNEKLSKAFKNNLIAVINIGGTNNLLPEVYALQRYCCNYLIILDYDGAGKTKANEIKNNLSVPDENIRYFMKPNKKDTELEDLYNPEVYCDYLRKKGIDINNAIFKNQAKKWSDKIVEIASGVGIDFSKAMENEVKKYIGELVPGFEKEFFTEHGYGVLCGILSKIEKDARCLI